MNLKYHCCEPVCPRDDCNLILISWLQINGWAACIADYIVNMVSKPWIVQYSVYLFSFYFCSFIIFIRKDKIIHTNQQKQLRTDSIGYYYGGKLAEGWVLIVCWCLLCFWNGRKERVLITVCVCVFSYSFLLPRVY